MKKILSLMMVIFMLASCSDGEFSNASNSKSLGYFAVFNEGKVVKTTPFASGKFTFEVNDANKNLASYRIYKVKITLGGVSSTVDTDNSPEFKTTSFPSTMSISFDKVAEQFGLTGADFNYGDSVDFYAEVTSIDGKVVKAATNTITDPTVGAVDLNAPTAAQQLATRDKTIQADLLNSNFGYNQAMGFNITVACPSFDIDAMVGTYTADDGAWDEYLSRTPAGFTIQCIKGAAPNTLIFKNFSNVGTDLVVTVNPATQSVTSPRTKIYSSFYTFGDSFATANSGNVFSCQGKVVLNFGYSVGAGNFGGIWPFILTKI
jgi:hypothetical protein